MDNLDDKFNELNQDDWTMILFMLFIDDMSAKDKAWSEFEKELVYQNRFSSEHSIVKELYDKAEKATSYISEGTKLFRARIFEQSQFISLASYYLKVSGVDKKDIQNQLSSISDWEKYFLLLPSMMGNTDWDDIVNKKENSPILSAYKKWRKLRYKGYDERNSVPPPKDSVGPGRANPDHIRYLYLSEDESTPVYEVRPIIGQSVSIARFRVKKKLKLYDLTLQFPDEFKDPEYELPSLFNSIGKMFSKPYNGNPTEYIPTQFLTEKIKNLGFDGVRFKSSLNDGGINIVLFSDEFCRTYASDLITVKGITIDIQKPLIHNLFDKKP